MGDKGVLGHQFNVIHVPLDFHMSDHRCHLFYHCAKYTGSSSIDEIISKLLHLQSPHRIDAELSFPFVAEDRLTILKTKKLVLRFTWLYHDRLLKHAERAVGNMETPPSFLAFVLTSSDDFISIERLQPL